MIKKLGAIAFCRLGQRLLARLAKELDFFYFVRQYQNGSFRTNKAPDVGCNVGKNPKKKPSRYGPVRKSASCLPLRRVPVEREPRAWHVRGYAAGVLIPGFCAKILDFLGPGNVPNSNSSPFFLVGSKEKKSRKNI